MIHLFLETIYFIACIFSFCNDLDSCFSPFYSCRLQARVSTPTAVNRPITNYLYCRTGVRIKFFCVKDKSFISLNTFIDVLNKSLVSSLLLLSPLSYFPIRRFTCVHRQTSSSIAMTLHVCIRTLVLLSIYLKLASCPVSTGASCDAAILPLAV